MVVVRKRHQQKRYVMALSLEQDEELSRLLEELEPVVKHMGEWDRNFTQDQLDRHAKYGSKIFMSPKQWEQLHRIHDEYVGHDDPTQRDEPVDTRNEAERVTKDTDFNKELDDEVPF